MTELPWPKEPDPEPDERSHAIRNVATVAALTPLLLFVLPLRTVPSAEAALVAVAGGVVAGIAWSVVTDHLALERRNDIGLMAVLILVIVGVSTLSVLLVPAHQLPTVLLFAVVLAWSGALTSTTRYLVYPAVVDSSPG
jgi:cytochrome bd-type quinol oxidase subunit 2